MQWSLKLNNWFIRYYLPYKKELKLLKIGFMNAGNQSVQDKLICSTDCRVLQVEKSLIPCITHAPNLWFKPVFVIVKSIINHCFLLCWTKRKVFTLVVDLFSWSELSQVAPCPTPHLHSPTQQLKITPPYLNFILKRRISSRKMLKFPNKTTLSLHWSNLSLEKCLKVQQVFHHLKRKLTDLILQSDKAESVSAWFVWRGTLTQRH